MNQAGMTPGQLVERGAQTCLKPVVATVADGAGRWAAKARRPGRVSRPFLASLLPLTLADLYRRRLAASDFDPFDARVQQAPPWRAWTLALHWAIAKP